MTEDNRIQDTLVNFPFLSYGRMLDRHYIGIVQNCDNQLISMYVLDLIPIEMRPEFIRCGEQWWWESNREIPINVFLKQRFRPFRPFIRHFAKKEFELILGPIVSLQETIAKRVRKRQVMLVRKPPDLE